MYIRIALAYVRTYESTQADALLLTGWKESERYKHCMKIETKIDLPSWHTQCMLKLMTNILHTYYLPPKNSSVLGIN